MLSIPLTRKPCILRSIELPVAIIYYIMRNSDYIISKSGSGSTRRNRLMGMLLIAIAIQIVNAIWKVPGSKENTWI